MKLIIAHLYPQQMNIYGDRGNLQALIYRCQKRGIQVQVKNIGLRTPLKEGSFDLLFAGGGQDRQQQLIAPDLYQRKTVIQRACQAGVPMLTICGTYQLFGQYFKPFLGPRLQGIGLFDAHTVASSKRKIGNIVIRTAWGRLVGFENHSGNTFLSPSTKPLGKVIVGSGNNGQDKTEGAMINNAFGGYLHGPLLPKNTYFCDYLIKTALENKYGRVKLKPLNDILEWQAHQTAVKISLTPGWRNWYTRRI